MGTTGPVRHDLLVFSAASDEYRPKIRTATPCITNETMTTVTRI